jgi:subtilase family serine protease
MAFSLQAAGRKLSSNHVPEAARHATATSDLAAETELHLTIGLPLRNREALDAWMREVYDPSSPKFRKFLTPEQFATQFGPTEEQYQAVTAFARTNHLKVTRLHSNRMVVEISGTASDIGKTFGIRLRKFHRLDGNGEFFAPDTEPVVPEELPVLDVSGLSNFRPPRKMVCPSLPHQQRENARPNAGSASGGGYIGNDFRAAYVPGVSLNGAGQSLALVEFDGFYTNDIAAYANQAGLAAVPVQTVLVDGYNGLPGSGCDEVSLDIEMALAMAPGLSRIISYEAGQSGMPNDILNRIATDNEARQIACSWTWGGGPSATTDQIFQQMAAQGQSFFCASGDSDAYTPGAIDNASLNNTPADSPYITSVGATTLTTTGPGGAWVSEKVWNWNNGQGSSGGISSYYSIPTWQQGFSMSANGGSTTMRNIPDVAMAGDNIYVVYGNGSTGTFGGTSCAAPLWAGFVALANQRAAAYGLGAVGFINPVIYNFGEGSHYAATFHDITTGNNTSSASPSLFSAVPGYDLCSGWGTPIGAGLLDALVSPPDPLEISPATGFNAFGMVGGPFNTNSVVFTVTNAASGTLTWTAGNAPAWLSLSRTGGTLAAGQSATLTASLNSAANALVAGAYTATVWFTNTGTGAASSRQFVLTTSSQLLQNGDFEAGSFTNWVQSGNVSSTSVTTSGFYVHGGAHGAQLGPGNLLGYLSQTISTVPGQPYVLSFWINNPKAGTPNQFSVSLNENSVFNQSNLPAMTWTNMHFRFTATSTSTLLTFGFRNDPAYFGLDDVSFLPVTAPSLHALTKVDTTVQFLMTTTINAVYQLQYITNLTQSSWINLGAPFTATNSSTLVTDPGAVDPQRFYRVIVVP